MEGKLGIKQVWTALQILSLLACIWMLWTFGLRWVDYAKKANTAKAEMVDLSVISKNDDEHYISAKFIFEALAKQHANWHLFQGKRYRTKEAAEEAIAQMLTKDWVAYWHANQDNSKVFSSLERTFPVKELFNAALVICIAVYFRWMKKKLYNPSKGC